MSCRILGCAAAMFFIIITTAAAPAFAQSLTDLPGADVSAGVFVVREANSSYPGIPVSASIRTGRYVRVVGELTICDCSSLLWAGFRVQRAGRVSPFVQVLTPLDAFALHPGVGVDVRFDRQTAARVGVDVSAGGDEGPHYLRVRFTTAFVVSFGR